MKVRRYVTVGRSGSKNGDGDGARRSKYRDGWVDGKPLLVRTRRGAKQLCLRYVEERLGVTVGHPRLEEIPRGYKVTLSEREYLSVTYHVEADA